MAAFTVFSKQNWIKRNSEHTEYWVYRLKAYISTDIKYTSNRSIYLYMYTFSWLISSIFDSLAYFFSSIDKIYFPYRLYTNTTHQRKIFNFNSNFVVSHSIFNLFYIYFFLFGYRMCTCTNTLIFHGENYWFKFKLTWYYTVESARTHEMLSQKNWFEIVSKKKWAEWGNSIQNKNRKFAKFVRVCHWVF